LLTTTYHRGMLRATCRAAGLTALVSLHSRANANKLTKLAVARESRCREVVGASERVKEAVRQLALEVL
jgi:hypothetical protein